MLCSVSVISQIPLWPDFPEPPREHFQIRKYRADFQDGAAADRLHSQGDSEREKAGEPNKANLEPNRFTAT